MALKINSGLCQLHDFQGLAPAVQTCGFDNDTKIAQPSVCILLPVWHSFSFASSKACSPLLKKLSRKKGFLTHCRACATIRTGKEVYCSPGKQMGCAGRHLRQGIYSTVRPAVYSQLWFCSAGGWEMSCSEAAAFNLPGSFAAHGCVSSPESQREKE